MIFLLDEHTSHNPAKRGIDTAALWAACPGGRSHQSGLAWPRQSPALPERREVDLVGVRADDLAVGAGAKGPPRLEVDRVFDEADRAVGEGDVNAAGVQAVG
jgi:hypothetical protein